MTLDYQELTEIAAALEEHRECLKSWRRGMDTGDPNLAEVRARGIHLAELRQAVLAARAASPRPSPAAKPGTAKATPHA
jgi:hypothetical protein